MRYFNAFLALLLALPALNGGQEMSFPAMPTVRVTGPTLDLKRLGARGDGVHNDSAAFRAAAEIIQKAGGGRLVIPRGVYIVGEQIHEDGRFPYYQAQPIFTVKGVDGLIIEGRGAVIRLASGLRFGSFDKQAGEPFQPKPGGFTDRAYAAAAGSMFDIRGSRNVVIRNLELDGNSGSLILGGYWGDKGRQLAAYGIALYQNTDVLVENVHTHHHGLDGIIIGWKGLKESDPPTPHTLINVVSEYNARQGLSWVGGRGLRARRCRFNHTGRGAFSSAPGAGVDIEAEESVCRDGYFEDCEFVNNVGCAMVADSGDGGYTRFVRCTFWGVSNWSTWSAKPGLVFEDCKIYGSAVHGFGSPDPALATRYARCHFEDKDYGANGVYRSAAVIECASRGDNITYEDCAVIANKTRSFWFDKTDGQKFVRGCRVMHRHQPGNNAFLALFRGAHIENTRFEEDYPPDTTARWRIEAQKVTVGANVFVTGPCVRWGGRTGLVPPTRPAGPAKGDAKRLDLGGGVTLELLFIPPGEFMMGSTPEEKKWATGIEGGATPGTTRESFEGEQPRLTRVKNGFWMGRTEVSVGQFRRFVEESGYVTDAEKPGGETQVFDHAWDGYHFTTKVVHPWKAMKGKSWRDPNWAFPNRDVFPVVCVSYNDMKAFCKWLTERERKAGRLPEGMEYRLPTEAEWEYACRGGSKESLYFWWGNELEDGQGRLNISAIDLLPGRTKTWPLAKAPWSDGFAFVSPVDHYGEKGRNGFGLADMCGGVWEFVLDHFDPKGGHEEVYYEDAQRRTVSRPVCRGGNYFDVPGNARCAVRLGIRSVTYSDSRDGFRICLGAPRDSVLPGAVSRSK